MPARKEPKGGGLTATDAWIFDGDLTSEEQAQRDHLIAIQTIEGRLSFLEEQCGKVLEPEHLPTRCGNFLCDAVGNWEVAGKPRAGLTYTMSPWTIAERCGYSFDSKVGFAARMLEDIHFIREARSKGNADRAMMLAFFLGHKVASAGIKGGHANKTRTGPRHEARNVAMAREFQLRSAASRKSDSALKADIGREYSLGRSRAIEAINNGLQILSEEQRTRTG